MLALLISKADPHKVPVLMIQGGIHPGESDGKDAGFMTLREILRGVRGAWRSRSDRDPVRAGV